MYIRRASTPSTVLWAFHTIQPSSLLLCSPKQYKICDNTCCNLVATLPRNENNFHLSRLKCLGIKSIHASLVQIFVTFCFRFLTFWNYYLNVSGRRFVERFVLYGPMLSDRCHGGYCAPCLLWRNGRPSQLLLSTCYMLLTWTYSFRTVYTLCPNWSAAKIQIRLNTTQLDRQWHMSSLQLH